MPDDSILYELFDINADAPRKEIRDRYFGLSKRFHPDKIGTKNNPDLKHKLEILFGRLTKAYDILADPGSRAEYDESVSAKLELWTMERKLKSAIAEKQKDEKQVVSKPTPDPISRPGVSSGSPPRATSRPAQKSSSAPPQTKRTASRPDLDERRRKLKQQRAGKAMKDLLARVSTAATSPFDSKKPRASKSPTISKAPPGSTFAFELIKKAELALERAKYQQAIDYLKEVQTGDPNNPQVNQMMTKAMDGFNRARLYELLSKGRQSQRAGKDDHALACFEKAIHADPTSMDARHLLADLLLETRSDLPRALSMARDIVSKGGQQARYFATLGELYMLNKQYPEARSALEQALNKTPGNDRYQKLLKACKK
jgi:tetratricopeptide (TPR) repeat protein